MIRRFGIAATLVAVALAGCTDDASGGMAVICTNFGPITVDLYDATPETSQNFLDLAEEGAFDGVPFHRIITGFMMQGGDVTNGDGSGGKTASGKPLPDETTPELPHDRAGLLSMANRGGDPTTGSSQFFITFVPTPHLNGKHTVFGEVTSGMDVVERVEDEASSRSGTPTAHVEIVTVLAHSSDASACPTQEPLQPASVLADSITPGNFHVTATTDRTLIWAKSLDDARGSLTWDLTGADGAALPSGWSADFGDAPDNVGGGKTARAVLELTVPEGTTGSHDLELHIGASTAGLTVEAALDGKRVSGPGDAVTVEYRGTCTQGGNEFDSGEFPTTLGSGRTVPGFDYGLMGLAQGEPATLVLPGDLAYGTSGGPTGCSGGELTFEVQILEFQ